MTGGEATPYMRLGQRQNAVGPDIFVRADHEIAARTGLNTINVGGDALGPRAS